jgi:hypothetical protein
LQYVDIAGNAYVVRRGNRLTPLRPDWVSIIGGVPDLVDATVWHPDAEAIGYEYTEGGPGYGKDPVFFLADEVAHFAPRPDPEARFRGMSWLTPIIREVMADRAMNDHKLAFLENGATPNLAVKLNVENLEKFKDWVKEFRRDHEGVVNAYKTMVLGAGADVTVVGADLKQLDFKITQGAGETRIAAAAGVPPVIVGLSEGLAAATYSNYAQARRRFADQTMRPLWRNACASLAQIIRVPSDAELWYDDRDIKALAEDQKDAAEIQSTRSQSIRTLIDAGYTPDTVVAAVSNEDFTLLTHSGLFSVQLQPPGTITPPDQKALPAADEQKALPPPKRDYEPLELLERFTREDRPINIQIEAAPTPDVNLTVEPAHVTVEPTRFEEGAFQFHVDAAPAPDVSVHVDAPQVTIEPTRIDEGAIQVHVDAAPAPDVTVNVESPTVTVEKSGKRRITTNDGRSATVTEGDVKRIEYDDGRTVEITEVPDE